MGFRMNEQQFDDLVDDATHAVNNLIPDRYLARLSRDALSGLLYRINDALSPILRDVVGDPADRSDDD